MLWWLYMLLFVVPLSVVALSFRFPWQPRRVVRSQEQASMDSPPTNTRFTFLGSSTVPSMDQHRHQSTWKDDISKLHIIVLVHGWLGNAKEMDYLKQSLVQQLHEKAAGMDDTAIDPTAIVKTTISNHDDDNDTNHPLALAIPSNNSTSYEGFVIHCATANHGRERTSDGIAAGGQRLATEIDQLVATYAQQVQSSTINQSSPQHSKIPITLSLIGNSLGGLYCRYAISQLQCLSPASTTTTTNHNNNNNHHESVMVIPSLFITTCTPHLGVSQHTYISIPSWMETPIAWMMQQTGQDLFRKSPLLQDMTIQRQFLQPLQSFAHRLAYINVYGTDFQVPTSTAAFWADTPSIHHVVERTVSSSSTNNKNNNNHIVLELATPRQEYTMQDELSTVNHLSSRELSVRLDQLGWTKVLVDVRPHLPWSSTAKDSSFASSSSSSTTTKTTTSTWTAKELLQEFDRGHFQVFPLGHTVMVANAKDSLNQYLTKGGQSTMDYLASTILQLLLQKPNDKKDKEPQ